MAKALYLNRPVTHLLVSARHAAGLSQDKVAQVMGLSKRTISRWEVGRASPSADNACTLARLVYPYNAAIAAELAAAASESLESLGLVTAPAPPPAPPPLPSHLVVDAIVCVAADALAATPSTVRGALHAAFKRARELRLSMEDVEKALAPAPSVGRSKKGPGREGEGRQAAKPPRGEGI